MDKRTVGLIQRAVLSAKSVFPFNAGWQALHREYNIGQPWGNTIRLSGQDKDELAALAKQLTGVDVRATDLAEFASLNRHEALRLGRDEKWAGQGVAAGRVLLKTLPGKPLAVDGRRFDLPPRGHLDLALESLRDLGHPAAIVVENYACFDRLAQMRMELHGRWAEAVVVYRGDTQASRADAVNAFLRAFRLPVLVLADIDPAGLLLAQALPGFTGLLAPPLAVMAVLLEQGSAELYRQQRPGAEQVLSNSPHRLIRDWWALIEAHGAGLAQERWLLGDVNLVAHAVDQAGAG